MVIPPPGSDPAAIALYVDRLVREADQDPNRQAWLAEVGRDFNLYLGNHFDTPAPADTIRLVLNRIQNAVIALVAIQAGDQPKITFSPRETGEPPICYLNTKMPAAMPVMQRMFAAGEDPTQPLDDNLAAALKEAIAQGQLMVARAAQTGMAPPQVPPKELLIEVNDQSAAAALQTVFDGMWDAAGAPYIFVENILNKNILGWQPTLYEFDDDELAGGMDKKHVLTNVHPKQVFLDPLNTDSSKWQYAVYDQPISADEAKSKWPQLSDQIDFAAKEGVILPPGAKHYEIAAMYHQAFQRHMVVVRTAWVRYQPYPLKPEQALAMGLVVQPPAPDAAPSTAPSSAPLQSAIEPPAPEAMQTPAGDAATTQPGPASEEPMQTGAPPSPGTPGVQGAMPNEMQPGGAILPQPPNGWAKLEDPGVTFGNQRPDNPAERIPQGQSSAYFLPGTDGAAVNPQHKLWPRRFSIRQITVVANLAVDDRECELGEIPLPTNRNLPIPFSPYGQGEPKRLEGVQMAINRLLSSMVTHHAYNAYPPELILASVVNKMDEAMRNARSKPGQRIIVPDDLLNVLRNDLKNALQTVDVPQMPADFWKLLELLLKLIDEEGNQSDVMQGNAEPGWSGEIVKALQNAASQVVKGKSMFTEFYLTRLARLMESAIVDRMTPDDWAKYVSKYPPQAIEALHTRNKSLDRNVSVKVTSASGSAEQAQTQQLLGARQLGVPIPDPMIMERLGVDPDAAQQQQTDWLRNQQAMAGTMAGMGMANVTGAAGAKNGTTLNPAPAASSPSAGSALNGQQVTAPDGSQTEPQGSAIMMLPGQVTG